MTASFIKSGDFAAFVTAMIEAGPVYGPVAKRSRFAFERLETPDELRLDYDVTILPPKKLFFPPAQDLLRFDGDGFRAALEPTEKILFGVHFYDVKAIDQTDLLFSERNYDVNYMAHRQTTTIVASNIQKVSKRAFFASVGADVQPKGHDAFLTSIDGGYVFETLTERGEALLKFGDFQPATDAQVEEAAEVNAAALEQCPEKLEHSTEAIAAKVRAAFEQRGAVVGHGRRLLLLRHLQHGLPDLLLLRRAGHVERRPDVGAAHALLGRLPDRGLRQVLARRGRLRELPRGARRRASATASCARRRT